MRWDGFGICEDCGEINSVGLQILTTDPLMIVTVIFMPDHTEVELAVPGGTTLTLLVPPVE